MSDGMKSLKRIRGLSALEIIGLLEENKIPYTRLGLSRQYDFNIPSTINIMDVVLCVDPSGQQKINERFNGPNVSYEFSSGVKHVLYRAHFLPSSDSLKAIADEWMGEEFNGNLRITPDGEILQYTYLIFKKNGLI